MNAIFGAKSDVLWKRQHANPHAFCRFPPHSAKQEMTELMHRDKSKDVQTMR